LNLPPTCDGMSSAIVYPVFAIIRGIPLARARYLSSSSGESRSQGTRSLCSILDLSVVGAYLHPPFSFSCLHLSFSMRANPSISSSGNSTYGLSELCFFCASLVTGPAAIALGLQPVAEHLVRCLGQLLKKSPFEFHPMRQNRRPLIQPLLVNWPYNYVVHANMGRWVAYDGENPGGDGRRIQAIDL